MIKYSMFSLRNIFPRTLTLLPFNSYQLTQTQHAPKYLMSTVPRIQIKDIVTRVTPSQDILKLYESSTPAKLIRKPDEILIKYWWCEPPFDRNQQLLAPVYNFKTAEFTNENVELDHDVFNQPLRRDIIHRTFLYRENLFNIKTHRTKTISEISGSGKKPHNQKKLGKARQGRKRAPGRYHGAKAHGPKMRSYRQELPKKVRLLGLKCMLSAKLAEGKIVIVDNEQLESFKTKNLSKILQNYGDKQTLLIVTGYTVDSNFEIASKNIQKINHCFSDRLNVPKLLRNELVIITKEGLKQLVLWIQGRTYCQFRERNVRRVQLPFEQERILARNENQPEEPVKYDPNKPLQFKFKILEQYLKDYEEWRAKQNTIQENNTNQQNIQ